MDSRQLSYFLAMARHEHMGSAAAELDISDSTLSRSIARLENRYGVKLFDRVGRGMRLNNFGRILLESVTRAFNVLETAERDIRATSRSANDSVSIGFTPSLGAHTIPKIVELFKSRHPDIQLRLIEGTGRALRDSLLEGLADFALGPWRFDDPAIDWHPLWDESFVAMVRKQHQIASQRHVHFSEIADDELLLYQSSKTTLTALRDMARLTGRLPNVVFQSDDFATLEGLVAAGYGTAVVPEVVSTSRRDLKIVRLDSSPRRTIGLMSAKARRLPSGAVAFRDLLRKKP